MRPWWVLPILLVSGCVVPPEPQPPTTTLSDCPTYPDGSPIDCSENRLRTTGILSAIPTPDSGWLCALRHRDDRGLGAFDFYVHQDGRIAYGWDLNIQRPDGTLLLQAGVYQEAGSQFLVASYQPKGFAIFDERKKGDAAQVHMLARQVRIDEKVGDEWKPVPSRPLISVHRSDAWYAMEFDAGRGPEYVSPMHEAEAPRPYEPDDTLIQLQGRELFVDVWSAGVKFSSANIAWPSAGSSRCFL